MEECEEGGQEEAIKKKEEEEAETRVEKCQIVYTQRKYQLSPL